jgi:ABC-type dipeptide/oligopeptide/nickel transport system permease subunit
MAEPLAVSPAAHGEIEPGRRASASAGIGRSTLRFLRSSALGSAAVGILLLVSVLAFMADVVAPYHPLEANYDATRVAPGERFLLGTDHLGRDVLSRVLYGAQVTMVVAISSVLIGETLGFAWGVISGYMGGKVDMVSQRLLEVMMSFPTLILALLLMSGLGAGLHTVVIAIAVTRIPGSARIIRSVVLSVKEMAYVEAVRCLGASTPRIMLRHVAPQCIAPMLVVASLNLGIAIFAEAALSFLGVGIPPPTPSWGNMLGGVLAEAFRPPWWIVLFPGLAITITILACNLLGDALRDFLDPRLRQRLM